MCREIRLEQRPRGALNLIYCVQGSRDVIYVLETSLLTYHPTGTCVTISMAFSLRDYREKGLSYEISGLFLPGLSPVIFERTLDYSVV